MFGFNYGYPVFPEFPAYPTPGTFVAASNAAMTPMSAPSPMPAPAPGAPPAYNVPKYDQLIPYTGRVPIRRPGELLPYEFMQLHRPIFMRATPPPQPGYFEQLRQFFTAPPRPGLNVPGAIRG